MRLLHFADLHLGIDAYGSSDSSTGLSTRVSDFLRAFDVIVDRAVSEQVDAVLFAGDAFKNRDPNPTLQREFARRIMRLAAAEIPTVLLVGNHDLPGSLSRATATEIYEALEIPGVSVCREIDRLTISTRSGDLQIVTIPWLTRSTFLSKDRYRVFSDNDLDSMISQVVSTAVKELIAELDPSLPAVMLAHLSLQGATYGFERSIMLGHDVTVGTDDLNVSSFDYVALGHIHKHQTIREHPPVVYAGSPERVDFGEEGESKGYVVVDIDTDDTGSRSASYEFVELPTRPFRTLRITAGGDAPMHAVEREIERQAGEIRDAIVRCYIKVDSGRESAVTPIDVRRLLMQQEPSHIAQIVVESDSTSRARLAISGEEALDSTAMLERWVEMKDYDDAFRERLLRLGRELIQEQREKTG